MTVPRNSSPRTQGVVIILVVGIVSLLAAVTLAFIVRARSAAEDNQVILRQTQARLMLYAGCSYILESGRIGWETDTYDSSGNHLGSYNLAVFNPGVLNRDQAYGWVDVRDGSPGPKRKSADASYIGQGTGIFPQIAGKAARFPMAVRQQPPFALKMDPNPNPLKGWGDPNFGIPLLLNPSVQPQAMDPTTMNVDVQQFRYGNPSLLSGTTGLAWFRIYRDGPATFIITCGAGGTMGYKDWAEVLADTANNPAQTYFLNNNSLFDSLLAQEARLWYRIEWSPAIGHVEPWRMGINGYFPNYALAGFQSTAGDRSSTPPSASNCAGTIQWVQRLRYAPTDW